MTSPIYGSITHMFEDWTHTQLDLCDPHNLSSSINMDAHHSQLQVDLYVVGKIQSGILWALEKCIVWWTLSLQIVVWGQQYYRSIWCEDKNNSLQIIKLWHQQWENPLNYGIWRSIEESK
jgi:hypothetical protein